MYSFNSRYSALHPYRLMRREMGAPSTIGVEDAMAKSLYCGMRPICSWVSDIEGAGDLPTGGVFNLEFSPEGSLLVAACEKKSIQIFDPLNHQRICSVNCAHGDCVNCVKFLDGRMFATCSDDTTIALWDVRNLKKKIRSLLGHSKWVKNIEFSVRDKLLVTSSLDGSVYTWDINSYTEYNLVYRRVFNASCLMRCRLSPDARQMVMCTTGGLIVIIHDLNLSTLAHDLHGFKPNLYRLMQTSNEVIPTAAGFDYLFETDRKQNRVEFVSDFPEGNDAKVVSALQIHPQGWTALSRNISHGDRSEWTCIHDIQPDDAGDKGVRARPSQRPRPSSRRASCGRPHVPYLPYPSRRRLPPSTGTSVPEYLPPAMERSTSSGEIEYLPMVDRAGPSRVGSTATLDVNSPSANLTAGLLPDIQNDLWEAAITIRQHRQWQEMASRGQVGRNFNMQRIIGINTGISAPWLGLRSPRRAPRDIHDSPIPTVRPSSSGHTPPPPGDEPEEPERPRTPIRQNKERLLYYIEETNEGKGFIKELCFSSDGRLVCSPYGRGIRLLALNDNCSELSRCIDENNKPKPLVVVGQCLSMHHDLVVSAKFSPRHHLLVTGCLSGKIVWYQPSN